MTMLEKRIMKRLPEILAFAALAGAIGLAVALQGNAGDRDGDEAGATGPEGNSFAIRGARVFDGERDLGVATVVVRDGVVEAVAADAPVPDGMPVVDGAGKTLLPGPVDARVHARGDAHR